MLELILKPEEELAQRESILVEDTKCAPARRHGRVGLIYGTPGSH